MVTTVVRRTFMPANTIPVFAFVGMTYMWYIWYTHVGVPVSINRLSRK
jgi:hypothetical protein